MPHAYYISIYIKSKNIMIKSDNFNKTFLFHPLLSIITLVSFDYAKGFSTSRRCIRDI